VRQATQPLALVAGERPPLLVLAPVAAGEAAGGRPLLHLEGAGTEHGEVGGDLLPQPLGERHHRHHGAGADDDAEQREQRAQRVGPQGAERHGDVVEELDHS
jgi:hypothetical protein